MTGRLLVTVLLFVTASVGGDVPAHRGPAKPEPAVATTPREQARRALFEASQLDRARQLAAQALNESPADPEALFVEMEASALEADTPAELSAALRLCELRGPIERDPRVEIAASRVLDLAANSAEFRPAIARIQALVAGRRGSHVHPQAHLLRSALIAAAADGASGINLRQVARETGLLTDWRVAGPFGQYSNIEFDQHWAPERDNLVQNVSGGHAVEQLRFDDGFFRMPQYFPRDGVFYAAAQATTSGNSVLVRMESPGTLEVVVDGSVVLRKDDRLRATPEIAWNTARLRPGTHHVVVKFISSAVPFRIALIPSQRVWHGSSTRVPAANSNSAEAAYIAAAQKYWAGDYNAVITGLGSEAAPRSAVNDFLMFQAWSHISEDSPEAPALLNAALQAAPEALAADYELAARGYSAGRTDEALASLKPVLTSRPNFAPAEHLMAQIAIRLHWPVEAERAFDIEIQAHPSCDTLMESFKFFSRHARYERAREAQRRLADCAPDTLAYVHTLQEQGRHSEAAAAAEAVVARNPLNRAAREVLMRELAWSGRREQAAVAAQELAALAPNSDLYRRAAAVAIHNPEALLDTPGPRSSALAGEQFYSRYRRDGVEMARNTAERKFSGGPAVILVDDQVARVADDGSVSLYVHKLTRVLDRDGVERFGEVALPRDAEVLELRTIKADGTVAEPEWNQQKATISMPALAPGDAIDQEYVVHYDDHGGIAQHASAFQHTFGSFAAPILYSRFVAITPASDTSGRAEVAGDVPPPRAKTVSGSEVRIWDKDDIAQSVEDVATARGDILPLARLLPGLRGWDQVRDRYRNELVDATRAGVRVEQMAARMRPLEPQARARAIYRSIATSVRSSGSFDPEDMTSAEATLAAHYGSRTLAVLAVARAAGLDASLVLARGAGTIFNGGAPKPALDVYSRPLLRFHFNDGRGHAEIYADAETEGLPFGAVPPTIERHDALLVPALREAEGASEIFAAAIVTLPALQPEQSVARGDVTVDGDGNLAADVTIQLGAWRGAQMRSILAGIEPGRRDQFYQQMATRIFPGAEDVAGRAGNEHDPDRPLEIVLRCRVPHFVAIAQNTADLDQLVPGLGLKKMYVGGVNRKFPLYIDTPLVESATFRVHLPAGTTVLRPLDDADLSSDFGAYTLNFRQIAPDWVEIQRTFRIPVQVVAPARYPDFSRFAAAIDDAERQRITVSREPAFTSGSEARGTP
ncbi:MAG: DUF3857 domain-containing protein [Terriglobales bacterium]